MKIQQLQMYMHLKIEAKIESKEGKSNDMITVRDVHTPSQ